MPPSFSNVLVACRSPEIDGTQAMVANVEFQHTKNILLANVSQNLWASFRSREREDFQLLDKTRSAHMRWW